MRAILDRNEEAGGGGFILGLLCGAAIGTTLGLLFAPKPGAALRRDLAQGANRLKEKASDLYSSASDAVDDFTSRGSRAVDELASKGSRIAEQGREMVDKATGAARPQTSHRRAEG